MDDLNKPSSEYIYQSERAELQKTILRIKVMLWAGDYLSAQRAILEVERKYGDLLSKALDLKSYITRYYLDEKKHGIPHSEATKRLTMRSSEDDALFILSPIANTIAKLDQRIAEHVNISSIITREFKAKGNRIDIQELHNDVLTGFKFNSLHQGTNRWEIKAYRFDAPEMNIELFIRHIEVSLRIKIALIEKPDQEDRQKFPVFLRAFGESVFLEITFFDTNRLLVSAVVADNREMKQIDQYIFKAISSSQSPG